jgi:hypothetical protein
LSIVMPISRAKYVGVMTECFDVAVTLLALRFFIGPRLAVSCTRDRLSLSILASLMRMCSLELKPESSRISTPLGSHSLISAPHGNIFELTCLHIAHRVRERELLPAIKVKDSFASTYKCC